MRAAPVPSPCKRGEGEDVSSSSGIKRFLEGCDAEPAVGGKERFLRTRAQLEVGVDDRLDRGDDAIWTEARTRDRGQRRVLGAGAAKQELVVLLAAFLHPKDADMADVVMSARIDAAGDLDLQVADLAEEFAFDEIRISHEQNVILPHVALADLEPLYRALTAHNLATANAGLITDIIACPGLDYCALANARSIPVAQEISTRFGDPDRQAEIGELKIKISGCINACGHHHVGHIGLLGVEKKGAELYQITLGGSGDENTSIGEIIGRGFEPSKVTDAIETIVDTYLGLRQGREETFLEAYRRVGPQPFKDALYGSAAEAA